MDKDNTQAACPDCITTGLTVDLPPIEATVCAVNKDKTTKKAHWKANKDQVDANWKVWVPNCFYDGNNNKATVVQCHLCQSAEPLKNLAPKGTVVASQPACHV